MSSDSQLPKVDFVKDLPHLKPVQLDYLRKIEKENFERAKKLQHLKRRNIFTGLLLGGWIVGVFFYSISAVKQENFLDNFEDPMLNDKK